MRRKLAVAFLSAVVVLGLVAEYFTSGAAAVVERLFYLALLGLIVGVLRMLFPPA